MNTEIYLKIEGIQGESQDANHKGWIAVTSFLWEATQSVEMRNMVSSGRVEYKDLEVHCLVDKATPAIMRYLSKGQPIKKVELSVCHASNGQVEYLRITLEEVLLTRASYQGSGSFDKIGINYQFQAAKVMQQYWEPRSGGGKGAETASGWNIRENREI